MSKRAETREDLIDWRRFEKTVATILDLAGFEHQSHVKLQGRETDIWCTARSSLLSARVIVECKSTRRCASLPLRYVTEFCSRLALARSSGAAEFGWLITNYTIPDNAWSVLREAHLEHACQILRPHDLLRKLLDIPSYLRRVEGRLSPSPTGFVDPWVKLSTARQRDLPTTLSFCHLLKHWLADPKRRFLLLLGDYGLGKTTCSEHLIKAYCSDNNALAGRVPLHIRLRDVANQALSISELTRLSLGERSGLGYPSFALLEYLARHGLFVFVFDGLDETTYSLRWTEIFETLKQILSLAYPGNKVLVTSRPAVFPSLRGTDAAVRRLVELVPDAPKPLASYVIGHLQPFDSQQVRQAIVNVGDLDIDETLRRMRGVHDLTDLARRPILLRMILESLDSLAAGEIEGHAELYRAYTDKWLARDAWRSNVEALSVERGRRLKHEFVQQLAWRMFEAGSAEVDASFVNEKAAEYCGALQAPEELTAAFANEVRVCSFLDCRQNDLLGFSHKSFAEYFTGQYVASLRWNQIMETMRKYRLGADILAFLFQMIDWRPLAVDSEMTETLRSHDYLGINILDGAATGGAELCIKTWVPAGSHISRFLSQKRTGVEGVRK